MIPQENKRPSNREKIYFPQKDGTLIWREKTYGEQLAEMIEREETRKLNKNNG